MAKFAHILVHLPYLAEVARSGSFTKAAEQLHITQAAVSYQIRQLEEKTGNLLLHRQSGGSTNLTGAGRALVETYEQCAKRLRLTLDSLNFNEGVGTIRLTTPIDFGSIIVPRALDKLSTIAPGVKVLYNTSDELIDLEKSQWDIAISSKSTATRDENTIYSSSLAVVASKKYLDKSGKPSCLSQIDPNLHVLLTRQNSRNRSWRRLFEPTSVEVDLFNQTISLSNTFAIKEAAKCGLGLAVLPRFVVEDDISNGSLYALCKQETDGFPVHFNMRAIDAPQVVEYQSLLREAFSMLTN